MMWVVDVLGHGLVLTTADPRVAGSLLARFPAGTLPAVAHLHVRVDARLRGPAVLRPGLHRWLTWSGGARGVLDCTRWRATVCVGRDVLADPDALRLQVLEAAALFFVTAYDRVPFHAAGLVHDGRAVLVTGPSGVGKSTLAWAATRAGVAVLAEDVVYVQQRPALVLHGIGGRLHVRRDVARRLGLRGIGATVRPGGVAKVVVALPPGPGRVTAVAGVVVLEPGPPAPPVPLAPAEATRAILGAIPDGFHRFAGEIAAVARAVVERGAWRLAVDARPERALPFLLDLLQVGGDTARRAP